MVQVLFTQTRVVQDGTGTTFEAGKEYDLPFASAERWKSRNVAVDAPEKPKAEPVKPADTKLSLPVSPSAGQPAPVDKSKPPS